MSAKIEARAVSKRFGSVVALDSLDLDVAAGEVFGIIGPNGAGKTTFLRILTGYWLASSGDVRVDGLSVTHDRFAVQARLGYACEQPKLYADHRVDTFLRMMGELRGLSGGRLRDAIGVAVERMGLQEVLRRRIGVLSKGFRQRVALAQALLHEPAAPDRRRADRRSRPRAADRAAAHHRELPRPAHRDPVHAPAARGRDDLRPRGAARPRPAGRARDRRRAPHRRQPRGTVPGQGGQQRAGATP